MPLKIAQAEPYDYPPNATHRGPQWDGSITFFCGVLSETVFGEVIDVKVVRDGDQPCEVVVMAKCHCHTGFHSFIVTPRSEYEVDREVPTLNLRTELERFVAQLEEDGIRIPHAEYMISKYLNCGECPETEDKEDDEVG